MNVATPSSALTPASKPDSLDEAWLFEALSVGDRAKRLQRITQRCLAKQTFSVIPLGIVEEAIRIRAFDCLPVLHGAGYRLCSRKNGEYKLARSMGNGYWPCPELFLPDLLDQYWPSETMLKQLLSSSRLDAHGAMNAEAHLERIMSLPHQQVPVVSFSNAFGRMANETQENIDKLCNSRVRNPLLALLIERGWLNRSLVEQEARNGKHADTIGRLYEMAMTRENENTLRRVTPQAPCATRIAVRL